MKDETIKLEFGLSVKVTNGGKKYMVYDNYEKPLKKSDEIFVNGNVFKYDPELHNVISFWKVVSEVTQDENGFHGKLEGIECNWDFCGEGGTASGTFTNCSSIGSDNSFGGDSTNDAMRHFSNIDEAIAFARRNDNNVSSILKDKIKDFYLFLVFIFTEGLGPVVLIIISLMSLYFSLRNIF